MSSSFVRRVAARQQAELRAAVSGMRVRADDAVQTTQTYPYWFDLHTRLGDGESREGALDLYGVPDRCVPNLDDADAVCELCQERLALDIAAPPGTDPDGNPYLDWYTPDVARANANWPAPRLASFARRLVSDPARPDRDKPLLPCDTGAAADVFHTVCALTEAFRVFLQRGHDEYTQEEKLKTCLLAQQGGGTTDTLAFHRLAVLGGSQFYAPALQWALIANYPRAGRVTYFQRVHTEAERGRAHAAAALLYYRNVLNAVLSQQDGVTPSMRAAFLLEDGVTLQGTTRGEFPYGRRVRLNLGQDDEETDDDDDDDDDAASSDARATVYLDATSTRINVSRWLVELRVTRTTVDAFYAHNIDGYALLYLGLGREELATALGVAAPDIETITAAVREMSFSEFQRLLHSAAGRIQYTAVVAAFLCASKAADRADAAMTHNFCMWAGDFRNEAALRLALRVRFEEFVPLAGMTAHLLQVLREYSDVPRIRFLDAFTVPVLALWIRQSNFILLLQMMRHRAAGDEEAVARFTDRVVAAAEQSDALPAVARWAMLYGEAVVIRRAGALLGREAMCALATADDYFALRSVVNRMDGEPEALNAVMDVAFGGNHAAAAAQLDAAHHPAEAAQLRRIAPPRRSLRLRARQ